MTDNNDYLRTSNRAFRLRADILSLMLKGAGYAAIFCFVLLILGWIILGISRALPADSKGASDPTPWSYLMPTDVTSDFA